MAFDIAIPGNDAQIGRTQIGDWPFLGDDNYIYIYPQYTRELVDKLVNADADVAAAINAAARAETAAGRFGKAIKRTTPPTSSAPNNAPYQVQFTSTEFNDDPSTYSAGLDGTITVHRTGRYRIDANFQFAGSTATGSREISISVLSGTTRRALAVVRTPGTGSWAATTSVLATLAVGDQVSLRVWQDSGGTRAIETTTTWLTVTST